MQRKPMHLTMSGALLVVVAILGLFVQAQTRGAAQEIRPIEPPYLPPHPVRPFWPQPLMNQGLQLVDESAHVEIEGQVARTRLAQTFANPTDRTIEGTYIFPLPQGAAISGFAMIVNGQRMEAEIVEGDKARAIYDGIVARLRDPAILEFVDRDLIRARIFPIAPHEQRKVELEYDQTLRCTGGSYRYMLPLRLPTGGSAQTASVDIHLRVGAGLRAVYSPTHDVEIERGPNGARITGQFSAEPATQFEAGSSSDAGRRRGGADRDFVLYYTTAGSQVGANLLTCRPPGEDGYFMLLLAPNSTLAEREIAAKDVVFVCDTSGSMQGAKIEQTRQALLTLLGDLNPADRFNIVTFASDVRPFRDSLNPVNSGTLAAARDYARDIKAVGGTDIDDALVSSLAMFHDDASRERQIIFMTDGQPTVGETDVGRLLKDVRNANSEHGLKNGDSGDVVPMARIFVFGVGYDVNTRLLDTLANENRGSCNYVLPQEDIEAEVGALYSKVAFPVLRDPHLDWGGLDVYDMYPRRLPDLFRGAQEVVFGRFRGTPTGHIELVGTKSGSQSSIEVQSATAGGGADSHGADDVIPRLWAIRKVGYLIDDARLSGHDLDPEVRDEIILLGKRYGIVTPFTAGLISEDAGGNQPPQTPGTWPNGRVEMLRARTAAPQMAYALRGVGAGGAFGQSGVAAAKADRDLRETSVDRVDSDARYIAGKGFFRKNGVWIDGSYDELKSPRPEVIKFGTPAYLALMTNATVARWLSLGDRIIIVLGGRVVEIEP